VILKTRISRWQYKSELVIIKRTNNFCDDKSNFNKCYILHSQSTESICDHQPQTEQLEMWYNETEHKTNFPDTKLRVGGLISYKDKLCLVNKRLKTVDIFTFNFEDKNWELSKDSILYNGLEYTYKDKYLASGLSAVELVGDTLFLGDVCKTSFCTVLLNDNKEVYQTDFTLPEYKGSESNAGIAFNYPYVYIAYHSNDYDREIEETQRLFAIDVQTDSVKFDTALSISENRRDAAHSLTVIKDDVWHLKDETLTKMSGEDGSIIHTYNIPGIKRPASICFYNSNKQ